MQGLGGWGGGTRMSMRVPLTPLKPMKGAERRKAAGGPAARNSASSAATASLRVAKTMQLQEVLLGLCSSACPCTAPAPAAASTPSLRLPMPRAGVAS